MEFPGVRQVFRIDRQVWRGKDLKPSREVVYGLTSLRKEKAGPAQLLALNRGHWSVENKSHYVRDVTFGEDLSQHRCGNAPAVLASLRNTAISIIKLAGGIRSREHSELLGAMQRRRCVQLASTGERRNRSKHARLSAAHLLLSRRPAAIDAPKIVAFVRRIGSRPA